MWKKIRYKINNILEENKAQRLFLLFIDGSSLRVAKGFWQIKIIITEVTTSILSETTAFITSTSVAV